MSDLNYLSDLEIDNNNLDKIVIQQPILNMRYHELYVEKLDELNEQKRKVYIQKVELEEVFAKLYLQNKKSGEKVTEKENESLILTNNEYKEKQKKYYQEIKNQNDIEKEVGVLEGVVKSFQMRKNSIEKAIDLYIFGYNGSVKQSNSAKDRILNKLNNKGDNE